MRIIGGKDYYDGAAAMGRDDQIVFVRHKDSLLSASSAAAVGIRAPKLPDWDLLDQRGNSLTKRQGISRGIFRDPSVNFRPVSVWFCGKRYEGLQVASYAHFGAELTTKTLWSAGEFARWCETGNVTLDDRLFPYSPRVSPDAWFGAREAGSSAMAYMIDNAVSVMTWHEGVSRDGDGALSWRVNGDDLRSLGFWKVHDVNSAFQELSMWVGGILPRPGKPMVEIDDRMRAQKHGFDKWSFRKPPAAVCEPVAVKAPGS